MNRSALLFVALLACALGADAARAQESDADLVTRINRLEAVIRQLTGNIEQLQYRNQQLEQQLQRLQADVQPHGRWGAAAILGAAAADRSVFAAPIFGAGGRIAACGGCRSARRAN